MKSLQTFFNFLKDKLSREKHILFVGFGNIERADDGFGILLAREIKKIFPDFTYNEFDDDIEVLFLRIIEGKKLVDFIVYLDAVDVNKAPGELVFLNLDIVKMAHTLSTHSSLLPVYFSLLKKKCSGQYLFGIQPASIQPFMPPSKVVTTRITITKNRLEKILTQRIFELSDKNI